MRAYLLGGLIAGVLVLAGGKAVAHHSFAAEYDRDRTITVSGVVQKLEWTNPHARIFVEGKDETGKFQVWDFELGPPNGLMRNGWNRNSLRQGHQVTVEGFRSKLSDKVANARAERRGPSGFLRRQRHHHDQPVRRARPPRNSCASTP